MAWRESIVLTPSERRDILDLCLTWDDLLGRESIDETRRRRVQHNSPGGHWLNVEGNRVIGYAGALAHRGTEVEMLGGQFDATLAAAIRRDRAVVRWWIRDSNPFPPHLSVVRQLDFMRAELEPSHFGTPPGLRRIDLPRDIDSWLAHNNASFANHPDQGSWTKDDFEARVQEPWFDPSAFLLWEDDRNIAASCWIKFHELAAERVGEIYVFSVDPKVQGKGWGRRMLDAGLAAITDRGVHHAVLYVDADNLAATALYESAGFTTRRRDLLLQIP